METMEKKLFNQLSLLPSDVPPPPESVKHHCIQGILAFTESLLSKECNVNKTRFLIAVTFGVLRYYADEEEGDAAGETTIDERLGFVPASKSAIDALEKVYGLGGGECVICLGNIDREAKRMPCGHVFLGDCIVEWLEKSYLCPLCRYAMPVDP